MKNAYKITNFAKEQGFDLVGFTNVKPNSKAYEHYKNWLDKKFNADMNYMSREDAVEKRKSAQTLLKNAKSIICLATNYYHDQPPLPKGHGRIARYAFGRDYHKLLKAKLKKIEAYLQEEFAAQTISYVDTGPLLERTLAEQAGLGYIGKNTCLITPEFGSWVLLSEIITDLEIKEIKPTKTKPMTCGTCTRCIEACPNKAISIDPKTGRTQVDSKKCLSYQTIESKKPLQITDRIFGCDICQEVCPRNCRAKQTTHKEFLEPKIAGDSISISRLKKIKTDEEYTKQFAGSPLMRAKFHKRLT